MTLFYRPWIPRDGMARTYADLRRAWGDPNLSTAWPQAILERVCQRGSAVPLTYDADAPSSVYVWPTGIDRA